MTGFQWSDEAREAAEREIGRCERPTPSGVRAFVAADAVLAVLLPVVQQALDEARLDERELLSARVYKNGWCPTCAAPADANAHGRKLAEALGGVADHHHRTLMNSRMHDPEHRHWRECDCQVCFRARCALAASPWGGER